MMSADSLIFYINDTGCVLLGRKKRSQLESSSLKLSLWTNLRYDSAISSPKNVMFSANAIGTKIISQEVTARGVNKLVIGAPQNPI